MNMSYVGENVIQTAKKMATCLQSPDKRVRKQVFIDLEKFLRANDFTDQELRDIFVEIHMYTLNGFRDKVEIVREQSIKFMYFLIIEKLPLNDFYLTYVCPVLVERIGSVELIEESEEIRLELVKFLEGIIQKYSNSEQLKPFLSDCVAILCETIKDKHPAIKELSCRCVITLAQALPKDFHMQAENLIKPIISCFGHQRYKVRVCAIEAIGEVIMHSSYKGLDEVVGPLAEKLFDQIPLVRRTVAQVGARWLREYRDRYSFFHKILPLLLTGLNDEVEETRSQAYQLWDKVGLQYQKENEKDLKDQLDFVLELPKYYPSNLRRPNLGCRVLVQRNVSKLTKALSFELTSWQEDIRVRCSQLLCSIALHAEDGLIQSLQDLLPAMYSASRDEDRRVVINIIRASELMGLFIHRKSWYKLILPVIEDGPHFGHLTVLSGFIKGTPQEYITHHLETITKLLADDSICFTRKKKMQMELLTCVNAVSEKYSTKSGSEVGYDLFKIIIALISLKDIENLELNPDLLKSLQVTLNFSTYEALWGAYTTRLLNHINRDPKLWLVVTNERCIFETILLESNSAFGENLDVIADILIEALNSEAVDAESRLKTFWALATSFEKRTEIFKKAENLIGFFEKLIRQIFVPSLVWRPGATAEALRTMAASCLVCALEPIEGLDLFSSENFRMVFDELIPLLFSLMEDASSRSRQLAVECIVMLKQHACNLQVWTENDLIKIYPELLKRLDDPTESVRFTTLSKLPIIFSQVPNDFKELHFRGHHELIVNTLLTHFDDDDKNVRDMVFEILKKVADINSNELCEKLERHKSLLCNQKGCEDILCYVNKC